MTTLNPVKKGGPITADDENAQRSTLEALSRQVMPAQMPPRSGNAKRFGIIGSSTATGVQDTDSNDIQWTYTITEAYKSSVGYGDGSGSDTFTGLNGNPYGWIPASGKAYNFVEMQNDGSGVQGNGINVDNSSYKNTSFEFIACPDNTIVEFIEILVPIEGGTLTREAWFYWHTPVDGEC